VNRFTSGQKLFDLKKPAHLCTAANKNAEGVPNPTGNKPPTAPVAGENVDWGRI
jgi:hypothetical protein